MKLAGCTEGGIKKQRWFREQQQEYLYHFVQDSPSSLDSCLLTCCSRQLHWVHSVLPAGLHYVHNPFFTAPTTWLCFPLKAFVAVSARETPYTYSYILRASWKFYIIAQMTQGWDEPVQERFHCLQLLRRIVLWRSGFQTKDNLGAKEAIFPPLDFPFIILAWALWWAE